MKQIIEDCKRVEIEDDCDQAFKTINIIRNDETFVKIDISYARLKGEWKLDSVGVYCSECKLHPDYSSNFCPFCGADMRGEEE